MKNKGLIITTIAFFFLLNTTYFWEVWLGILLVPAYLILVGVFVTLLVGFFKHLYFAIKEKFNENHRNLVLILLTFVIGLTLFKPFGLIDFEKLEGADLLIASREGGGNCTTTLKLKENNKFIERSICFGISEIKGTFILKNDTIYFDNVESSLGKKEYHKFAIIKKSKFNHDKMVVNFVKQTHSNKIFEYELMILKNDLNMQKDVKPYR